MGCSPRQQLRTEKQIQDTLRGGKKLPKDTQRDTDTETEREKAKKKREEWSGSEEKRQETRGSVAEVSSSEGGEGATATQCEKAAGSTHSTKTTNSPGHTDA